LPTLFIDWLVFNITTLARFKEKYKQKQFH